MTSWCLTLGSFVPKNSSNRAKSYYSVYWFFWDLRLTSYDIPKDAVFPKILVLSNIFGFPAVNWTPKWTKTVNFVCVPFEQKFKFLTNFSNTMFVLLEDSLWSKLTIDVYLNKVFHLTKSWGVKMSVKFSFLATFRSFLNTTIKTVAYLMHHLACHHWSKVQTKLTNFREFWPKGNPKAA